MTSLRPAAYAPPAGSIASNWIFWTALLPVLAAIAGFGGVYSYIWAPVDVILFAGLVALLWRRVLRRRRLLRPALLAPMIGFGLLVLAQWQWGLSIYPGATLTGIVQLASCGAAFYLMYHALHQPSALPRFGWILWAFCGGLALEATFQAFGANGNIYWFHNAQYATPVGPFVYHNFYAGCIVLLLPLAAVVALRPVPPGDAAWALWLRRGLVPAVALGTVVIARSRGGILILAVQALLAAAVFWPDLKRRRGGRRNLVLGLLLLFAFSLFANWGPVLRRFGTLSTGDVSFADRLQFNQAAWRMFLDHPWLGTGFNTFATAYPAYNRLKSDYTVLHAHDDFVQALAETGVAGGACILVFLGMWVGAFARRRRLDNAPEYERRLQLAAFLSGTGFIAYSLGDFQFHAPGNALLFFLVAAAAVVPISHPKGVTPVHASSHHRRRRLRRSAFDAAPASGPP